MSHTNLCAKNSYHIQSVIHTEQREFWDFPTEFWIYGDYGDGFGKPEKAFFTPKEGDDLRSLRKRGLPGVYDIPEGNNDTHFTRSLKKIKEGLAKNQVASTRPQQTLGAASPTSQMTQSIS